MAIFRQYIAPLLVVVIFLLALVAVSARIFLPSDMAAPAPVEDVESFSSVSTHLSVSSSAPLLF
ncbi:hypothetical protein ACF3DV_26220 [Chlorogloeopsis fritschii PCC 9212]|jgi:hypothetical protein|uniref:Uncharacterized protein n=1 Tax=Chlorogloeopsis fritschii PCC 6912 TaxID=211165 RepID=A0A433NB43_CHLFR|nr:hypothetical protein [Chlorogloeopsis fritschii]MBF2007991.1 hypothetical protein [Chlorogloeopsis fritschii C42_A2020_084]RUR79118.1 hypothetical protein PCC6912_32920 [Chlorogloeopsis fritschii PCC 6912]